MVNVTPAKTAFYYIPFMLLSTVVVVSIINLGLNGFNANLVWFSETISDKTIHYRTILTYAALGAYCLTQLNRFTTPKQSLFYTMCIVLFCHGTFEITGQFMLMQHYLSNDMTAYWIKNGAFILMYLSFIIPLTSLYDNHKEKLQGILTKKTAYLLIAFYTATWIYLLLDPFWFGNITFGVTEPLSDLPTHLTVTNEVLVRRVATFLLKLYPAVIWVFLVTKITNRLRSRTKLCLNKSDV
jgi:hypothetical protein